MRLSMMMRMRMMMMTTTTILTSFDDINNDGADGEGEYINSLAFTAIGTIWHCKAERPLVGDILGLILVLA